MEIFSWKGLYTETPRSKSLRKIIQLKELHSVFLLHGNAFTLYQNKHHKSPIQSQHWLRVQDFLNMLHQLQMWFLTEKIINKSKNQTKQSQTTTKKDELSVTPSFSIFSWSRDRIISINIPIWQEKKWEAHSCHWPLAIVKYCWIYILRMPVLGVGNVSCVFSLSLSLYLPPFFPCSVILKIYQSLNISKKELLD